MSFGVTLRLKREVNVRGLGVRLRREVGALG